MSREPTDEVRERIGTLIGRTPTAFQRAHGGYTPADRWLVDCGRGAGAFAKVATTPQTANALRAESAVYAKLRGPFMPALIGWEDHAESPVLVIEDLRDARWPPPWDRSLVDEVLRTVEVLHGTRAELEPFDADAHEWNGWRSVAGGPEPFLGLGVASRDWLDGALPALIAASDEVDLGGDAVTHFDIRSDNLCHAERGVVLVDWNGACLGNPTLDLGFWLPSLQAENGPPPEASLPDAPEIAAFVSGFFAARAGLPPIPNAPRVRSVQREQLQTALPWAVRALKLPALAD